MQSVMSFTVLAGVTFSLGRGARGPPGQRPVNQPPRRPFLETLPPREGVCGKTTDILGEADMPNRTFIFRAFAQ